MLNQIDDVPVPNPASAFAPAGRPHEYGETRASFDGHFSQNLQESHPHPAPECISFHGGASFAGRTHQKEGRWWVFCGLAVYAQPKDLYVQGAAYGSPNLARAGRDNMILLPDNAIAPSNSHLPRVRVRAYPWHGAFLLPIGHFLSSCGSKNHASWRVGDCLAEMCASLFQSFQVLPWGGANS
jgi:hypothetical protein